MSSSHRSRRLVLALAAASLAVAPASAAAMPAGPDAPSGSGSTAPQLSRVPAPGTGGSQSGDEFAVTLAAGAFVVLAAGGISVAYRQPPPFWQS